MAGPSEPQTNGKSPAVHTKRETPKQLLPQHLIKDPFYVIPHIDTYSGYLSGSRNDYYVWFDQSLRDSIQNSLAMRRDGFVHELIRHRQLPVVGLPHHVEIDDPEEPDQKSIASVLSAIVSDVPRFQSMKLILSEADYYGKYACQTRIGPRKVMGNTWNSIDNFIPVNGDKIRYLWDGTPGVVIRAGSENTNDPTYSDNSILHRYRDYIQQTMLGPALFLTSPFLRDRFVIHNFEPMDTDYLFEIEESLSVHGLGLRSRYYWLWNMRVELLSWMLDALQRVGANGMLYAFYPFGNSQARNSVIDALKQLVKDNVSAFPIDPTNQNYKDVIQKIDPSQVGYDQMFQLITHLEEIMRRGILGQDLSSKSKPTGLGRGASDLQGDVREDYIIYDANSLYETLDDQLLKVILRYNYFLYRGQRVRGDDLPFSARLKAQVDKRNVQEQMEAAEKLFNMGVDLDKDDVRDIAGFSPPKKRHSALVNPQIKAAMQQFEAGIPGIKQAGGDFKSLVSGITQKAGAAGLMGGNGNSPAPAGIGGGGQAAKFAKSKAPEDVACLAGELYQSKSGWGLLKVPNALVRGIFDAIRDPGLMLPPDDSDKPKSQWKLNAHISVIRPEEIEKAGGLGVITEWGHHFHYQIGSIKKVKPAGWDAMKEAYFVDVESPELEALREKYGLSRLPNNGKYRFHISVAVRLKNQRGKPVRFAKAGDVDDCGHDPSGEFSQENECAGDGEFGDYGDELPLYSDDDVKGEIKRYEESGDKARLAIAKDELRSRMREKRSRIDRITDENYASNLEKSKGANSVILRSEEKTGLNQIMVHKSARDPGKWQLTFFSFDGKAAGHEIFDTQEDAIASASGKFVGHHIPHGHHGYKVKEVARKSDGRVKIDRFRRLAGDAELSPRRFARAGSAGDCGHERRGGEFARGNTCATKDGGDDDEGEDRQGTIDWLNRWFSPSRVNRTMANISSSSLADDLANKLQEYHPYLQDVEELDDLIEELKRAAEKMKEDEGDGDNQEESGDIPFRLSDISMSEYDEYCNEIFGHDMAPETLLRMAGLGVPSKLFPGVHAEIRYVELGQRTRIAVNFRVPGKIELEREFQKTKDGKPYIRNELFRIDDPDLKKRGGVGQEVFSNQVDEGIKAGMAFISCYAAGNHEMLNYSGGNDWSGYYVWPRFGYDGHVSYFEKTKHAELSQALGRDIADIRKNGFKISDLMMTKDGRDLWKRYGGGQEMQFDLSEGSLSRRILSAYRKEKGVDDPEGPDRFKNQERVDRWAMNEISTETRRPTRSGSSRPRDLAMTTKRPSIGPGSESAGRMRRSGRNTEVAGRRGSPARFSRITIPDDVEAISAAQVAALIADQYWNKERYQSLDDVIHDWVESPTFHLMEIPTWIPSPYRRIEPDDPAYTSGPIIVEVNKNGRLRKMNGSFGQSMDIVVIDGQHRQREYLDEGIDKIEAYVGSEAIPIIEGLMRDYAPYREKFKDALERYYTSPGSTTLRGVVDAGKAVGLSLNQTDLIFENFRSGVYFDVNTGEFHQGDVPDIV